MLVYVSWWRTTCHGCGATHFTCLVGAWATSDKPGINQYYVILFIQASHHPDWPMDQIWWSLQEYKVIIMLVYVVRWRITGHGYSSPIPHVLWVHLQGLTGMEHTQYTGILFIQALEYPNWLQAQIWWWALHNNNAIFILFYFMTWWNTWYGFGVTHSTYLVGTCERSDTPESQSIHYDPMKWSLRPPKLTVGPD